ncbi:MAG: AMP-binding protein [Rhodospirillales bacterium]|jgi:long-chain acyl-CoA synthetase|nr:AMP-binding protein [Rhodospirillales bacterium]
MNIGSLLIRHSKYRPDHPAFVCGEDRFGYRDFNAEVNRLSNALIKRGLKKGDAVFATLSNSTELMTLYWMAAKTGIIIVPVSTLLQASGLKSVIMDCESVMVFAESGFTEILDVIKDELETVMPDGYVLVGCDEASIGYQTYANLISGASDDEPPEAGVSDDDIYNIMYTSGTTGAPKGIIHTHYVRAHYCTIFASSFRMTPESVVLHAGSIVFNGAMIDLMPWMFVGCTYILHKAFDPVAVMEAIQQEQVTHMVLVPAQIIQILNHPGYDPVKLSSLQMILSVGAPLALSYKQQLNEDLPGCFYELYGLTEGMCTVLDCKDSMRKAGSVGVPPPFYELKIIDKEGNELPAGEIGEICGRAPVLMPGYFKRPDLTEAAMIDGWLKTGDVGYVDEEGFLYLVDRIKDMIITGGVNVYPKDIEDVLNRHEAVSEVAVFGANDPKWGEVPVAAVLMHSDADISSQDLMEWCNTNVGAKYQRLKNLIILDKFPRNIAGKTLKREISESYQEGL